MTDAKQTKCPHCGSTFSISDAQLAAKGGSVRCGSCLQVFRADMHLVGAPARAPKPAATPGKAKKKDAQDESWAHALMDEKGNKPAQASEEWKIPSGEKKGGNDDFGFSDDDISEFISKGSAVEAPQGKTLLFDDELSDQLESVGEEMPHEENTQRLSDNADESWAQNMLSDLQDEEQKQANKKYSMEILDDKSKAPPKNPKLAAAMGMGAAEEPAKRPSKSTRPAAQAPAPADDFLGEDADVLSFLDDDDLGNSPAPVTPPANPFSLDRPLAHVDAPVVLKPRREPVNWGHLLTWTFLCLIAVAMFLAQYTFFNFESLAIKPAVRPWFERACAQFSCRLPDIPDPAKLKVEELVVRKHSKVEGALVVDAILKNGATFPQPFPVLRLRFSNSTDELVASRLLKPMDYLQGEARLLRHIPPDTPVHISLEIVDPGKDAVNYSLNPAL